MLVNYYEFDGYYVNDTAITKDFFAGDDDDVVGVLEDVAVYFDERYSQVLSYDYEVAFKIGDRELLAEQVGDGAYNIFVTYGDIKEALSGEVVITVDGERVANTINYTFNEISADKKRINLTSSEVRNPLLDASDKQGVNCYAYDSVSTYEEYAFITVKTECAFLDESGNIKSDIFLDCDTMKENNFGFLVPMGGVGYQLHVKIRANLIQIETFFNHSNKKLINVTDKQEIKSIHDLLNSGKFAVVVSRKGKEVSVYYSTAYSNDDGYSFSKLFVHLPEIGIREIREVKSRTLKHAEPVIVSGYVERGVEFEISDYSVKGYAVSGSYLSGADDSSFVGAVENVSVYHDSQPSQALPYDYEVEFKIGNNKLTAEQTGNGTYKVIVHYGAIKDANDGIITVFVDGERTANGIIYTFSELAADKKRVELTSSVAENPLLNDRVKYGENGYAYDGVSAYEEYAFVNVKTEMTFLDSNGNVRNDIFLDCDTMTENNFGFVISMGSINFQLHIKIRGANCVQIESTFRQGNNKIVTISGKDAMKSVQDMLNSGKFAIVVSRTGKLVSAYYSTAYSTENGYTFAKIYDHLPENTIGNIYAVKAMTLKHAEPVTVNGFVERGTSYTLA